MSYSFCFYGTCNIWDLIVGIFIPSSISLPTLPFTRSVIFHPRDLVTCCNIGWNLTEWAQSIFLSCRWTNPTLDAYASTYSIGNPRDTFSVNPVMLMTVDAIKASSRSSDYIWSDSLNTRLQRFLLLQHEHRDKIVLHNNIGYVHHGIHIMAWTSLSIDVFVTWSRNWSSVDQWTSIEVY
jgi:hypothetical protein